MVSLSKRKNARRNRQKRIDAGLCVSCSNKALPGKVFCGDHRKKNRERNKKYWKEKKWKEVKQ